MKTFLSLLLFLVQLNALAQWAIPTQMRAEITLDRLFDDMSNSDLLYGVPMPPGKVIGDNYLDKKWNKATILLYQSETLIEGYPVKYDIKSNLIEIGTKSGIKVLDVKKIKNIVWIDSLTTLPKYFVNSAEYNVAGVKQEGLLEVLADGDMPLFKVTEILVKKPTYNAALDVGTRDTKILHEQVMYYARGGELIRVKNKSDVLTAAGDKAPEIEKYIKANKLSIKSEIGLKRIFEQLNSK